MREALRLSAAAGLGLGTLHAVDVAALGAGAGVATSWRLLAMPGIVGLIGCLSVACSPLAWAALAMARRAPSRQDDDAWTLGAALAAAPTVWAAHRLYRFWASEALDFPAEAALAVAAATAVVAASAVVGVRWAVLPLLRAAAATAGERLWPIAAVVAGLPLYGVASRTMPAVHLDDRLIPYVVALLALAALALRGLRTRRIEWICAVFPLLVLAQPAAGRKAVRRAAPLADAAAELALSAADRDGDGHAASWLTGSDCDDGDPAIGPGAAEIPGDGIDNNCLAGDLAAADAAKGRVALGVGAPAAGIDGQPRPRLIVLVTVDALRADRLHPASMPRTWALAGTGVRFDRAYAAGSHTRNAVPPLLTGQYLGRMLRPAPGGGQRFSVGGTLAGLLAAQGWHTIALQTAGLPGPLLTGFRVRIDLSDMGDDFKRLDTTPVLVRELMAALAARPPGKPVFAWLHTMDVHAPYRPSYDDQVSRTDAALGVLYDHLAERAAELGPTVVAFSADHGEALGERGRFGHGRTLEDDQVLVPLALTGPGVRAGHLHAGVVEVIDLPPTLLALAGAPIPAWMDGRSLLPLLRGESRPGGQRAFLEVRGLGGSFLRGAATPYATVVRDLRRDLEWRRPADAPDEAISQARTLLLAWEEAVLSAPPPAPPSAPPAL